MESGIKVEYLENNAAVKSTCPCCSSVFKPFPGLWPFLVDSAGVAQGSPVCEVCEANAEDVTRKQAILRLVRIRTAGALDDVSNNMHHYEQQIKGLQATLSQEDIAEVEQQFEVEWAKQSYYCSGRPIKHN